MQNTKSLRNTLNTLLLEKLKKYSNSNTSLNKETCTLIYQDIFLTIQEIILTIPTLEKGITDVGINYVAQSVYDMIQLNGPNGDYLIEDIFDRRAKVEDISTQELKLCLLFLIETPFQKEIITEIKRRN